MASHMLKHLSFSTAWSAQLHGEGSSLVRALTMRCSRRAIYGSSLRSHLFRSPAAELWRSAHRDDTSSTPQIAVAVALMACRLDAQAFVPHDTVVLISLHGIRSFYVPVPIELVEDDRSIVKDQAMDALQSSFRHFGRPRRILDPDRKRPTRRSAASAAPPRPSGAPPSRSRRGGRAPPAGRVRRA
jgi:hypothetical protein